MAAAAAKLICRDRESAVMLRDSNRMALSHDKSLI